MVAMPAPNESRPPLITGPSTSASLRASHGQTDRGEGRRRCDVKRFEILVPEAQVRRRFFWHEDFADRRSVPPENLHPHLRAGVEAAVRIATNAIQQPFIDRANDFAVY